jgi:signal peptidase I
MERKAGFLTRHSFLKDGLSLVIFIFAVIVGTFILNSFVFKSYNVLGSSMENTLHSGDRVIVNRLPVTWAHLWNKDYVPERGQIIVFTNPKYQIGNKNQYIIKRVIAFAGERVRVKDGILTVWTNPEDESTAFHPDEETYKSDTDGPKKYTSGEIDKIVPEGEVFVSGDNREGDNSYDSRNGLGTVPFYDIIGPAGIKIYPLNQMRFF